MAAVVVANRVDTIAGDKRVIYADLSSVDNADTWVTGLQKIDWFHLAPEVSTATGGTISGGTITFAVASGTLAGKAIVHGS